MKNTFSFRFTALFVVLSLAVQHLNAQVPVVDFYGTPSGDEAFHNALSYNGFHYITGRSGEEATLTQTNGNTAAAWNWTMKYGSLTGHTLLLSDIQVSLSGNILLAGISRPFGGSWSDNRIVVMEVSQINGSVLQTRYFNLNTNSGNHRFSSVKIVKSVGNGSCPGAYILQARRANGGDIVDETLVMKLDFGLNPLWANVYNDGFVSEWETYNLIPTPTGGAVIAGLSTLGNRYGTLMEVDANGVLTASKGYQSGGQGTNFFNIARDYKTSGAGDLIVVGGYRQGGTGVYRGVVAKILTNYTPSATGSGSPAGTWSKDFPRPNEDVLLRGLTQFQVNNGSIYTGYFTPDASNPGFFEPRVLRVNTVTGAFQGYRNLGGPNTADYPELGLSVRATNRVLVVTGMPGTIGGNDGWFYDVASNLNEPNCVNFTSQAAINLPMTMTTLSLNTINVLGDLVDSSVCSPSPLTWAHLVAGCPPYGNKPSDKIGSQKAPKPDAEFAPLGQVAPPSIGDGERVAGQIREASAVGFDLFPNPASQDVDILFLSGEGSERPVQIFDLNGKLLRSQTVNDAEQSTLDLSDLPPGVYVVKVGDFPVQKLTKL